MLLVPASNIYYNHREVTLHMITSCNIIAIVNDYLVVINAENAGHHSKKFTPWQLVLGDNT